MVVNGWVALTTQDVAKYAETIINLNGGNEDMKKTRLELFIEKTYRRYLKMRVLKHLVIARSMWVVAILAVV